MSPAGRTVCSHLLLSCAVAGSLWGCGSARAQTVREDFCVTNGHVRTMVRSGNTLYVGGSFGTFGPATGCAVPIDASSGDLVTGFPKVAGTVYAVAADGSGGWFIGGDFTAVGGTPRPHLAHVLADGTLAPWDPSPDGTVFTLTVGDGVVFAGGQFSNVGGQARHNLAALDATTGLATAWDPNPDGGRVGVLARSGVTLYVVGSFWSIGGQSRTGLAAFDVTTGLATAWDPQQDGGVDALATNGGTVYVGGWFTSMGGQARNCLAALDSTTGLATAWNPVLSDNYGIGALAVSGSRVYVGGNFSYCTGTDCLFGLGAFDATTGLPTAWDCSGYDVRALVVSGTRLYVAGWLTDGLESRSDLGAVDAVTGELAAWDPRPNNAVLALAVDGTRVFAGGDFTSLGGVGRSGLAAIDLVTGLPTDWNPDVRGSVAALALSGSTLYAGGDFTMYIPVPGDTAAVRNNLAAFDLTTGQPTIWNPNGHEWIRRQRIAALAVSGSTVYVGGRFDRLGGLTRNHLAALNGAWADSSDQMVLPWNPSPTDSVSAIALDGDIVYVGGCFDSIGAQPRGGLAALSATAHDSTDGVTLAWDPKPWPPPTADRGGGTIMGGPSQSRGPIHAISVMGSTVYVGGPFEFMGGHPTEGGVWRRQLAAIDATTGLATAWDAGWLYPQEGYGNLDVTTVVATGGAVYVGGSFGSIGGQPRNNLAALDPVTGVPTAWNPDASGGINALLVDGPTVYAGGWFNRIGGLPQSGIAAMGDLTTPTLLALVSAEARSDRVRLAWFAANGRVPAATVYRRTGGGAWSALGQVTSDGTGRIVYEDTQVSPGVRYGYRLGIRRGGVEEFLGETWVEVPRVRDLALLGARPNPAVGSLWIAFTLPNPAPATLGLFDLAGRRVRVRDVGSLGAGEHRVHLDEGGPLPAGIYVVRLAQAGRTLTRRVAVIR